MVATPEPTPALATPPSEPVVLLAIPQGAWRAMVDLAQGARTDGRTHHHLRAALNQITQVDCVLHTAVMVDGDEVEVSLHSHAAAADAALTGWLADHIGIIPGPGLDWRSLRDGGLLPEGMMGSRVALLPVDLTRPGEEGHRR
jgi:hypothetical protein